MHISQIILAKLWTVEQGFFHSLTYACRTYIMKLCTKFVLCVYDIRKPIACQYKNRTNMQKLNGGSNSGQRTGCKID